MKSGVILAIALLGVVVSAQTKSIAPDPETAVVKQYCTGCHSDRGKAGGLSLAAFDAATAAEPADVAQTLVRKPRAGLLPPPGARRPAPAALAALPPAPETRPPLAAPPAPPPPRIWECGDLPGPSRSTPSPPYDTVAP